MAKVLRFFILLWLAGAGMGLPLRAASPAAQLLGDSIAKIAAEYPAEIGVAVIIGNADTIAVNDRNIYPMMSVFKLHQALAVCSDFDRRGASLDSVVTIWRDSLDARTWSPMLGDFAGPSISLPVRELMRYTLTLSDNNASNYMFGHLVDAAATDAFIATIIPRSSFSIVYTEEEMSADHSRAYANTSSPLGAAMLIDRLFTGSTVSAASREFITGTLGRCATGTDRIAAPLLGHAGLTVAHKTGSGYVDSNGVLAAHNDVAFVRLPDGRFYSIAVFVKDFHGDESAAAAAIARISALVYDAVK